MNTLLKFHALRLRALLLVVAVMAAASVPSHAQFRASIQGSVTDPSGAAIPNAKLTLKDNATNQVLTATSDSGGVYNFNALPPDHFTLTATAPGFTQRVIQDLQVIPEQPNSVNIMLQLGETTTTVTVTGDTLAAIDDTETSNIGATISANEIQHMPSFNRDVFTLTQLAPGAVG